MLKSSPLFPILLLMAAPAVAQQVTTDANVTAPSTQPRHPAKANGPHHAAYGTIRSVTCSYPSVIEFKLVGPARPLKVYNNNFAGIDVRAVNFDPDGPLNPCKDFEGMKADIQYAESSDKSVSGQVFLVELHK
ncbi:hypothetical protein DYQ86_16840 [Acidobacteria bacterium AB60]|nr:hypothetical protein DYQ86_16840 [Acidobacteria bacterium AB60]